MSHPLAPAWLHPEPSGQLDPRLWPAGFSRGRDGEITIGGQPVSALVGQFGSPLYVVDLDDLSARAARVSQVLHDALSREHREVSVYYATKALLTSDVVRVLASQGFGFDVSTGGEMEWTLRAGVPAKSLEFQGNNKSDRELIAAMGHGVGAIVVDSEWEAARLVEVSRTSPHLQQVLIRVNTGVHASTHDYLATAREDQKFGIARDALHRVAAILATSPNLELVGLHSHIGSQIVSPDGFVEATVRMLEQFAILSADYPLTTLNLGGGFAIPYTPADPGDNLEAIASAIAQAIDTWEHDTGLAIGKVAFEPGRIIVGPSGVTLYTVGTTKLVEVGESDERGERVYVSVDGGMSDNLRPALYRADYTATLANRVSDSSPALCRVVGKHCESGDIVVNDCYLPSDTTAGDLLAVAATGAYCHSLSNNYNALGRPALVVVESGQARVALAGESLEDVLARDRGLSSTPGQRTPKGSR